MSVAQRSLPRPGMPALALLLLMVGAFGLAWLVRDAPLVRARGLLHADALSALLILVAVGHGLVSSALGERRGWRGLAEVVLVSLAALMGHLALAGVLLAAAALLGADRVRWLAAGCSALGLGLIGFIGGEWRHGLGAAGAGMNSVSLALLVLGALLAAGGAGLPLRRAPAQHPVVAAGCWYALLRLFSLGPWNLGWLFAALLLGAAVALWAAWEGVVAPPEQLASWHGLVLSGLLLVGAGLASGAGLTLAGYALLCGPVLRLGLSRARPSRALWLLSAAAPLSAPFVVAWMGVAAATAGGVSVLAMLLWGAALLAALGPARLAFEGERWAVDGGRSRLDSVRAGAMLSAALGLGAPLVLLGLLRPVVAQLQGGLTPFGTIELWPWAGLIALDAAQQPVATLPSLALAALMLVLCALCWVILRLRAATAR